MDVLIRGGELVDGTGGARRHADVVVREGHIEAIEAPGSVDSRQAASVIEAKIAGGAIPCWFNSADDPRKASRTPAKMLSIRGS